MKKPSAILHINHITFTLHCDMSKALSLVSDQVFHKTKLENNRRSEPPRLSIQRND